MFNISYKTEIENLEKTGVSKSHIQACLNDRHFHEKPKYDYFSNRASTGTVLLHTRNGDFTLKFYESDGWAKSLEIL